MTSLDPGLLDEALEMVRELSRERVTSRDAQDRLAPLRARWPAADLALVRDEEVSDGSVSFDVLVREPAGTVSVAYSPAPALPWPLRGAVRHSDSHLARVGTRPLDVGEALAALDFLWYDHDVLARLVDTCLIHAELERDPVEVGDAELQAAADAYRRAKGLLDADSTARWLAGRGLSADDFTKLVADTVAVAKLRERVTAGRVAPWFAAHRADFDTLVVAWVAAPTALPASDALAAVTSAVRSGACAGVTRVAVAAAAPELRDTTGGAVSTVVGGVPVSAAVVGREPAVLDSATRPAVERAVFDDWLAERRAAAGVEWFWLARDRTAPAR